MALINIIYLTTHAMQTATTQSNGGNYLEKCDVNTHNTINRETCYKYKDKIVINTQDMLFF